MRKVLLTAALLGTSFFAANAQNAGKIYLGSDIINMNFSHPLDPVLSNTDPNTVYTAIPGSGSGFTPLIGFSNQTGPTNADPNRKSVTAWGVNLNGGYYLNESWAVGLGLGFGGSSSSDTASVGGGVTAENKTSATSFTIMPYLRYMMPLKGKWSAFVDGGIKFNMVDAKTTPDATSANPTTETKITTFGIFVRPGIDYMLNERWTLRGSLSSNFLAFNSNTTEVTNTPANGGTANTVKATNTDLGLNLSPLSGLSMNIGVYYTFGK